MEPFALANLGCVGTERRLVDCPVEESKDPDDDGFLFQTDYNRGFCDPYVRTFALIACGSIQDEGVYICSSSPKHSRSTSACRCFQVVYVCAVTCGEGFNMNVPSAYPTVLHGEGRICPVTPRNQNNDQPSGGQPQQAGET